MEKEESRELEEWEGEAVQPSFGLRSTPYLQDRKRKTEEWVLVPIESETGQLVVVVLVAEQWLAAAVAAHSSVLLSFLVVLSCFRHPGPNHRAAAAGIGIEGVGYLQV